MLQPNIFVPRPPLPQRNLMTTASDSSTDLSSLADDTITEALLVADTRTYKVIRVEYIAPYTDPCVQFCKGPGNECKTWHGSKHLLLGRHVTSFASRGLWIRITCDQPTVDCGLRWVALAEGPTPEKRRGYLEEDADAAHRCVQMGCTNTSTNKFKEKTMW